MLQLTRAAWLYELLYSPQPLRERLALIWSNHFVVGTDKVKNRPALAGYLALLRRHAATPSFARLRAGHVAQSPAMLRYLDNDQNRSGKPNENFSRELLELFTAGIGPAPQLHRSRTCSEGARALTGWSVYRRARQSTEAYLQAAQGRASIPSSTTTARKRTSAQPAS